MILLVILLWPCVFVTQSAGRKALQQKVIDLTILISEMLKSSHGPLGSQVDQLLTQMGDPTDKLYFECKYLLQ